MRGNACLHRSYLDSSAIQVSIYDDRIEVDSPGMLYDGLNITEALSGKSKCRNKAIAEAFQYMKIIEGWGTGLPRLFRQCKEMELPEPRFEEFGDGIKVTIYRSRGMKTIGISEIETEANDTEIEAYNSNTEANHTETEANETKNEANKSRVEANNPQKEANRKLKKKALEMRILSIIEADPQISQIRIAEKTGLSRSTIQRYMVEMEKEGRIQRLGGTRGSWIVQEIN